MRAIVLAGTLFLGGCSVYLPQPLDTSPPPGTNVRARLTTPGAVRVSGFLGGPTQEVEGKVLTQMGDSLALSLLTTTEYGRPWDSADTLFLGFGEIYQLDEKRMDKKRSAFFAGGVAVVTSFVVAALFNAAGRSEEGDPPGEIDVSLIPLFSFWR